MKRRIFGNVIRYFRSWFLRKYVNWKREIMSWLWIKKLLIPPHPLTNIRIQKYCQNEPIFNELCSEDN